MLLRFRVSNYRSFREEQELSLIAGSYKDSDSGLIQVPGLGLGVLRVAAIYGANASGKSNLLKAMTFMESAVRLSHRKWDPEGPIPYEPFLLDATTATAPSLFEMDFVVEGVRYQYGFTLTSQRIHKEWLLAYPRGKKQTWFTRDSSQRKEFSFGKNLTGENRAVEAITRSNSLFLSAAAQNNHELLSPLYKWFVQRIQFATLSDRQARIEHTAKMLNQGGSIKDLLLRLIRAADLGIVDADVREEEYSTSEQLWFEALSKAAAAGKGVTAPQGKRTKTVVALRHESAHDKSGVPLQLKDESYGTQAFFSLCGPLIDAFAFGEILLVDELDASLHTKLAIEIVKLFNNTTMNDNGQLIFNTHDTNLLSHEALRRDQIWFTEKDANGASHLYPLSDFRARSQENLERGYLQGRYGAVPFIGSTDFLKEVDSAEVLNG